MSSIKNEIYDEAKLAMTDGIFNDSLLYFFGSEVKDWIDHNPETYVRLISEIRATLEPGENLYQILQEKLKVAFIAGINSINEDGEFLSDFVERKYDNGLPYFLDSFQLHISESIETDYYLIDSYLEYFKLRERTEDEIVSYLSGLKDGFQEWVNVIKNSINRPIVTGFTSRKLDYSENVDTHHSGYKEIDLIPLRFDFLFEAFKRIHAADMLKYISDRKAVLECHPDLFGWLLESYETLESSLVKPRFLNLYQSAIIKNANLPKTQYDSDLGGDEEDVNDADLAIKNVSDFTEQMFVDFVSNFVLDIEASLDFYEERILSTTVNPDEPFEVFMEKARDFKNRFVLFHLNENG